MRLLRIIFVALFAVVAVAGCGLFKETTEEKVERALDEGAGFTVFLNDDATDPQRSDVRAWLERQPSITEVSFEDKATAYKKFKELWAEENPEFVESVNADSLPESFRLKLKDAAATREIRDGAAGAELAALPGVQQVVYQCTTIEECRKLYSSTSPSPPN